MNSVNAKEVLALRNAFHSVKERQKQNTISNFEEKTNRLKLSRGLSVGNDELLEKTIKKLKANGFRVYLAKEKQEAIQYILNEIGNEKLVVKSKFNVIKELGLTKIMDEKGIKVI